jgi:hypothetical protein
MKIDMEETPTFYFLPQGMCNIDISHVWRVTRVYTDRERMLLSYTQNYTDVPKRQYIGTLIVFKDGRRYFNYRDKK